MTIGSLAGHPEAADGAVLLAPLLEVSRAHSPLLGPEEWHDVLDHLLLFTDRLGTSAGGGRPGPESAEPFLPRSIYREVFGLVERNRGRAGAFRTPLLIALAGEDGVIDNDAARAFYRACAAPSRRLLTLPHAGHVLPAGGDWRALVEAIAGFAGSLPRRPALAARGGRPAG